MSIKFDLVITNPPYGSIGANITKNIIDNVDYDEYINLLPANDYKRNTEKNLFQYAREMENINDGFDDAKVTTHLCKIAKEPNSITLDQFEISNYIDRSLDKYFTENVNRPNIDFAYTDSGNHPDKWNISTTFLLGWRDICNNHMPFDKQAPSYKWNVEKSIDVTWIINNLNKKRAQEKRKYEICFYAFEFKTIAEKNNFTNFVYSKNGFRFISKLFTAMNSDGSVDYNRVFPKVDWTHSWTVEEILEDYGYTELEIKDIIKDLDNFKGQ